jgi:hypothetical protein
MTWQKFSANINSNETVKEKSEVDQLQESMMKRRRPLVFFPV